MSETVDYRISADRGRLRIGGRWSWSWALRIAILLLSLIAAALYSWNRIVTPASLEGVVNAPLITLRAPIDGVVTLSTARAGEVGGTDVPMFQLVDRRVDRRRESDLRVRLSDAEQRASHLDRLSAELATVTADLRQRAVALSESEEARISAALRAQHANVIGAAGALALARAQEDRARALRDTGTAPQTRLDDAIATRVGALAAFDRAKADVDTLNAQLNAIGRNVFLQAGFAGTSYVQQKSDEIQVRMAEIRYQHAQAMSEIGSLRLALAAEEDRVAELRDVSVLPRTEGHVTSVYVAPGTEVLRGNPLADMLDCSALYVEANVSAGWFARPRPGDPVRVRIYGEQAELMGHIRTLRDSGMALDPSRTIPIAEQQNRQSLTLIVDFDPSARRSIGGGRCPVGRPATVLFN